MTLADAGNYTCNATSEMGTADATATLPEFVDLPRPAEVTLIEHSSIYGLSAVVFIIFMIITGLLVHQARVKKRNKIRHKSPSDDGES